MKNKGILAKALALILVLLMCLPMVVACDSGTGKDPVDSTASNNETTAPAEETDAGEEETTEEDDSNKVPLRVMSFNVQGTVYENARYAAVKYNILSYAPDLLGLQEDSLDTWGKASNFTLEGYTQYSHHETVSGVSSERVAIYVKDGIKVKESGGFVLADAGKNRALTYHDVKKGGAFELSAELYAQLLALSSFQGAVEQLAIEDALNNGKVYYGSGKTTSLLAGRRATYVVAEKEGQTFIYVNTHLQNRSQTNKYADSAANVSSNNRYELVQTLRNAERMKSMQYVQQKIEALKKVYPDAEVIITGDFNDTITGALRDFCNRDADGVWDYVTDLGYRDSALIAKTNGGNLTSTWNGKFSNTSTGQSKAVTDKSPIGSTAGKDGRIDFCFVSEGIGVSHYQTGIHYDKAGENGREYYLSDHLSLVVDIRLG